MMEEREVYDKAEELVKLVRKVKGKAITGTLTYSRLQKLYFALDAYLVECHRG